MAAATCQPASMGTGGELIIDTMAKLDEIRISERALTKATAKQTIPAFTHLAPSDSKGGRRINAARGSPKRYRQRNRWRKQQRRACPMTSTRTQVKPQQPRSRPEAPYPAGQRRLPDKIQIHHHNSDTWYLTTAMPLKSQATGALGDCILQPKGIG
ncbi:Hypothetical predicted protein [Pelobates cultripes]|uniref:Uncharacterized protein n=1 Tax=Pelobates cultripes TaxID=61616 RepID=A0AAD1RUU3_PELCU|nr:Hypothetical predicted protein [Pelobates cultripes]